MAAVTQLRNPTSAGRDYYERKLADGTTHKEALRCLKRRLSDVVFRQLVIDLEQAASTATPGAGSYGGVSEFAKTMRAHHFGIRLAPPRNSPQTHRHMLDGA